MEYPKRSNTHVIRVPEVEEREKGREAIFKEILTEFSNTGKKNKVLYLRGLINPR